MELPKGEVKDDILRSQLRHWQIPVRLGPVEKPMLLAGKVAYIGYPSASDYLTEKTSEVDKRLGAVQTATVLFAACLVFWRLSKFCAPLSDLSPVLVTMLCVPLLRVCDTCPLGHAWRDEAIRAGLVALPLLLVLQ